MQIVTIVRNQSAFVDAERDLGLTPINHAVASSYGSAVATANLAKLNAWTTGEGWKLTNKTLYFPKLFAINGTWDTGSYYSFKLVGNGHCNLLALNQYTTIMGPASGLVNVQSAFAGPMLRVRNHGMILEGMNFFGWYHPTSYPTLLTQIAANGARKGIEIEQSIVPNNGVANGKMIADALTIGGCITGLKLSHEISGVAVADADQAHADQILIGRLYTPYCTNGVKIDNHQSLGNIIHYYDAGDVQDTAIEIARGGKTRIGYLSCESTTLQTGLKITGSDNLQVYSGEIYIGTLNLDGTFSSTARAINVNPTSSAGTTPYINVGHLDMSGVPSRTTHVIELNPYFYGRLNIQSGTSGFNGMIKNVGGALSAQFYPIVSIRDFIFRNGQTPTNTFSSTSASTGRVLFRHEGCCEQHNFSGASNPQAFFPVSESFLNLG
jgi:hypothetical protein